MIKVIGVPDEIGVLNRLGVGEAFGCTDFAAEHGVQVWANAMRRAGLNDVA